MSRKKRCAKRRTTVKRRRTRKNVHPPSRLSYRTALKKIRKTGLKDLPEKFRKLAQTKSGRTQLRLFADFYRVEKIPSMKKIPSPLGSKLIPAVGMGTTSEMFVSDHPRGRRGKKTKVIRGRWNVVTRADGEKRKSRTIYFMTGKKLNGKMRHVGWAPRCVYIIPSDIEALNAPKAGFKWKHLFSDQGGIWPEVYADTPTLSKKTNFVVTNGTFTVSDWIRR